MRRYVLSLAALALLFGPVGQAHARLIGTDVVYEYRITPSAVTDEVNNPTLPTEVTDNVEFDTNLFDVASLDVDVDALSINFNINVTGNITFTFLGRFNGPVLTSLEWGDDPAAGDIIDFDLSFVSDDLLLQDPNFENRVSSTPGGTQNTAGPHSIAVNLSGLELDPGEFFFDITLLVDHQSAPIPEPGTLLLIGSGLVGIGVGARRRNRRK